MTAETQKSALQTYLQFVQEVQCDHKFESINKLVHSDFVDHSPAFGLPPTREGVEIFMRSLINGFPDLNVDIEMQTVNGDKVWTRKWLSGTHLGTFSGIEATKKEVRFLVMDIVRVVDGKFKDHWNVVDTFSLMKQLGAI